MRLRLFAFLGLISAPLLGLACAEAGALGMDDDTPPLGDDDDAGSDASTRSDGAPATPPKGSSSSSSGGTDGGKDGGKDGGSTSSGGSSGGSSGSSQTGNEPDVCTGTGACSGAEFLGVLAGGGGTTADFQDKTINGTSSKWVSFTVKDCWDGSSTISWAMDFTPPAGTEYVVRVADALDGTCSSSFKLVAPNRYDDYGNDWSDTGAVDDHEVFIEIRQISAVCPSSQWTLRIDGTP